MDTRDSQAHWDAVYTQKALTDVSWYQTEPRASWELMGLLGVDRRAPVLDVGGGDSLFVDFLLRQGFTDITVLDISAQALSRGRARVGDTPAVQWVAADVTTFRPDRRYALWHDRAVLHFLTQPSQIAAYVETARVSLLPDASAVVGTFSDRGPSKCSGLTVERYSQAALSERLASVFAKLRCVDDEHVTPALVVQYFTFCAFHLLAA